MYNIVDVYKKLYIKSASVPRVLVAVINIQIIVIILYQYVELNTIILFIRQLWTSNCHTCHGPLNVTGALLLHR